MLASQDGGLGVSHDGGRSLRHVPGPVPLPLADIVATPNGQKVIVAGFGGARLLPVAKTGVAMNSASGTGIAGWFERQLFAHRIAVLVLFAVISVLLGWRASLLTLEASFQKMVPVNHPFIANYLKYENELRPLANVVRISVENTKGDIFDGEFLDTLKKITDEVFYMPGVDRGNLKSLWTPNMYWLEVTEEGLDVGPIIPKGYDGSAASLGQVELNVLRSGGVGSLVANDLKSAMVLVPLQEVDPQTGAKLDYGLFAKRIETLVRERYQSDDVKVHVTGFAKVVGDLIEGAGSVALFFGITFALTAALLLAYSRCWRSTLATLFCCLLAVVWQLGIVQRLGFGLDPYSILVPFLTFAIGVSHAVQNINTMASERYSGRSNLDAARVTFRALFLAGSIALLCDAVGFSTLLVIRIGVIQELRDRRQRRRRGDHLHEDVPAAGADVVARRVGCVPRAPGAQGGEPASRCACTVAGSPNLASGVGSSPALRRCRCSRSGSDAT